MRDGSSIAATNASAVNWPMPGIVISRRQAAEALVIRLMSASIAATAVITAVRAAIKPRMAADRPATPLDATWKTIPNAGNNFNSPSNWMPEIVPTGTAFFGGTSPNGRSPLITANTTLGQIEFMNTAPSYSIGVLDPNTLEFTGLGVINSSIRADQVIVVLSGVTLIFANNSSARGDGGGNYTVDYSNRGGAILFNNNGTASNANFENQSSGTIIFRGTSQASSAVISNNFGAATVTFQDTSNAGSATINRAYPVDADTHHG